MRWAFLLAGLTAIALQTGCGTAPAQLGITGPAPQAPLETAPSDTPMSPPGLPDPNAGSGADQRFYRYN